MDPRDGSEPRRDRAGVLAPPPVIFAIAFLAGWLADRYLPLPRMAQPEGVWLGWPLIAAGSLLGLWGIVAMRRRKTAIDPYSATTAIVTEGPYRFSRNPLYLALTLVYAGMCGITASIATLALLPVALAVLTQGVIKREERYLEGKFGDEYREYRRRVRRWL